MMAGSKRTARLVAWIAAFALAEPVAAAEPADFATALETGDYATAVKALATLIEKRGGKAGPDAALDTDFGLFFATQGLGTFARPYLERAIAAAKTRAARDPLAFELARSLEVEGEIARAEAAYRALSAADTQPAVRARAILSLARLRLGAAPAEAIALLAPLTDARTDGATRWEAHLLTSRALAIAGRAAEAHAALTRAWEAATAAAYPADAIAITAMDMAVERAEAGDRSGEIGLLAAGRSATRFTGLSQLPVCGRDVTPDDSVIVAVQADEKGRPVYSAVRASRPGIAQFFTVPLAANRQAIDHAGFQVRLRCRTGPDANLRIAGGIAANLTEWLAREAYYPLMTTVDPYGDDRLTQTKDALKRAEAGGGADSPALVPALLAVAILQGAQSRFSNQEKLAEARATAERALAILVKAGAPEEVVQPIRIQITVAFALNSNIAEAAGPVALELFDTLAQRPDTRPEQAFAMLRGLASTQLKAAQKLALFDHALAFFDRRGLAANHPMRQAVELRRAAIQRELGLFDGIGDRLAGHGLAPDLCAAADQPPTIPPATITLTPDDYPKDVLKRELTGAATIELSLDAGGAVTGTRIVASLPVGLFDAVTAAKLEAVRLNPARRAAAPSACRGLVQTVFWQLPATDDFAGPWDPMAMPGD